MAGIAGIYPVFDFRTYPGLETAAKAFGVATEKLAANSANYNPVERVASLAKARVPTFLIHGDTDAVVPLAENSAEYRRRYESEGAGELVQLVIAKGQGHNYWEGFFRCEALVEFAIKHARAGAAPRPNP